MLVPAPAEKKAAYSAPNPASSISAQASVAARRRMPPRPAPGSRTSAAQKNASTATPATGPFAKHKSARAARFSPHSQAGRAFPSRRNSTAPVEKNAASRPRPKPMPLMFVSTWYTLRFQNGQRPYSNTFHSPAPPHRNTRPKSRPALFMLPPYRMRPRSHSMAAVNKMPTSGSSTASMS